MQNMNCICNENRRTGCGACVSICPKSAISMVENAEGFLYPVIDSSKCVDCEECFKTCLVENAFDKYDEILDKTVELVSKDKLILIALGQTASVLLLRSRQARISGCRYRTRRRRIRVVFDGRKRQGCFE